MRIDASVPFHVWILVKCSYIISVVIVVYFYWHYMCFCCSFWGAKCFVKEFFPVLYISLTCFVIYFYFILHVTKNFLTLYEPETKTPRLRVKSIRITQNDVSFLIWTQNTRYCRKWRGNCLNPILQSRYLSHHDKLLIWIYIIMNLRFLKEKSHYWTLIYFLNHIIALKITRLLSVKLKKKYDSTEPTLQYHKFSKRPRSLIIEHE